MSSLSFWFCMALALLTVVLVQIEDSHALQCYSCGSKQVECKLDDCSGSDYVCVVEYLSDGARRKTCQVAEIANTVVGGAGKCKEGLKADAPTRHLLKTQYEEKKLQNPQDPEIENKTADQYANEKLTLGGAALDDRTMKMCTCDTDSCNDEAFDKKNMPKGSSSSSSGSVTVAVMLLAFALLAAIVPGFRRSQ